MEVFLKEYEVYKNVDLINLNTYRLHSKCKYLVYPRKIKELIHLLKYLKENKEDYIILGNGSNVILTRDIYNVVIKLDKLNIILINNNIVEVECGVNLVKLLNIITERNLGGLEFLVNIPGQVGASTRNNAGAFNKSIGDYVKEVKVIGKNNQIITLNKEELNFNYRYSYLKENKDLIIISTTFELEYKSKDAIKKEMLEYKKIRLKNQPYDLPSAGSVFKNPLNNSAGKLIENLGLRGHNIGGAMISKKHANFIVNKGNATSTDIIDLINFIKEKVKERYNIELELEQEIIN